MKLRLLLLLFIYLPISLESQSFKDVISTEEKIYGLSKVWSEITYNFAFIDQVSFDVDSLYKQSIKGKDILTRMPDSVIVIKK